METEKIFEILEIAETKDENLIKEAYRKKLVTVNPEDNPEGFKRLREAYEAALRYAAQQEDENPEKKANDPVSLYIERLNQIYRSLPRRLDIAEWETILKDELLDDLDLCEDTKWGIFRFLANNYELPTNIWRLLDQTFHIERDQQQFKEHLPVNFVDFILWSCSEEAELSAFPFHQLTGNDTADYDEFLHQLNALTSLANRETEYEDRDAWLKEQAQKIAYLDTLNISHPYYELEKARYALAEGNQDAARQAAESLLADGTEDSRLLLGCARIYRNCGREEEAEQIYRTFLEQDESENSDQTQTGHRHTDGDIYASSMALGDILFGRKDYVRAKEYAFQARNLYHTQEAQQLLIDCSNAIIEQMTGESAPEAEPTVEEGLDLAECFIVTRRAAEGVVYFDAHPVLNEDTSKCHRAKALLYNNGDRHEEALTETLLWRRFLEADSETEPSEFVQNYVLEAKVHEQLFSALEDKQTQEALSHKEAAFTAFDNAFRLIPDDINLRVSKYMFLKTLWEAEPSEDYYQQAATLCEEMIELDKGYFWAYYYAQEAYEKLRRAQKVVDYFYAARRIYAGLPEIYERAAEVFRSYEQWNDLGHILQLAEEAGAESDFLKVLKLELLRVEAKSEQQLNEAEDYGRCIITEMEENLKKESLPEKELDKRKGNLAEAYRQRALLHDNNGNIKDFKNLDDIEKWVLRSVELKDGFANRYFLGYFYLYEKRDHLKAYEHLKVCEEKGKSHWVYRRIALCHEHWKQWNDAIKYYKLAAELAPDHNDYLWRIGWLYRAKFARTGQQEYFDEAIKYLDLQMERFGDEPDKNWEIWWQYSALHTRNREYEKALEEIERALKEQNEYRYIGHKADVLALLGRHEEAFATYELGIENNDKEHADYTYAYTQIYNYFCRNRAYREGLAWFEEKQPKLWTDDQREKNLDRIKMFYLMLGNWQKALETLEKRYINTTLKRYVCDTWTKEGDRISDLLDAYRHWLSNDELRAKAEEAANLLERKDCMPVKKNLETKANASEGKRKAYNQIGLCYSDYLLDDETALLYFKKAFEHAKIADADNCVEADDYREIIDNIMGCLWRLGRPQVAISYRELYMKHLAKDYEECAALGKSVETMHETACNRRHNCYHLFKLEFFCGEYEKAAERLKQIEASPWCWHCKAKECTEAWECKGYIAWIRGDREEAIQCFEKAVECASLHNDDAQRELRRLRGLPKSDHKNGKFSGLFKRKAKK